MEGNSIIEIGNVIKASASRATVRLVRRSECEGCNACGMGNKHLDVTLNNTLSVTVGDSVKLRIVPVKDRMFAVILYLLPLVLVAIAMGLSKLFNAPDYLIAIVGFLALAIGLFVAYATDKYRSNKYNLNPTMLEVVSRNSNSSEIE